MASVPVPEGYGRLETPRRSAVDTGGEVLDCPICRRGGWLHARAEPDGGVTVLCDYCGARWTAGIP